MLRQLAWSGRAALCPAYPGTCTLLTDDATRATLLAVGGHCRPWLAGVLGSLALIANVTIDKNEI